MDLFQYWRDAETRRGKSACGLATAEEGISELQLRWREALVLWLRWNRAYEQITERMFNAHHDPDQLQAILDDADRLRKEAIARSHELLD